MTGQIHNSPIGFAMNNLVFQVDPPRVGAVWHGTQPGMMPHFPHNLIRRPSRVPVSMRVGDSVACASWSGKGIGENQP